VRTPNAQPNIPEASLTFFSVFRHIYAPLVSRGVPPMIAQMLVFVFSGFLHELLVGVPTHNILCESGPRYYYYDITDSTLRGCIRRYDVANSTYFHDRPPSAGKESYGKSSREHGLLDQLLSGWTTSGGAFVLFCLASEIWKHE
jgi:hypothetical protein